MDRTSIVFQSIFQSEAVFFFLLQAAGYIPVFRYPYDFLFFFKDLQYMEGMPVYAGIHISDKAGGTAAYRKAPVLLYSARYPHLNIPPPDIHVP